MSRNPALVLFVALALIAPGSGIRAIDAASRLGRRRQFGDIRRAVRPGQSQALSDPSGIGNAANIPPLRLNLHGAGNLLRLGRYAGATRAARDAALYRRLAADLQCAPALPAKTAASAPAATGDEQFHTGSAGAVSDPTGDPLRQGDLARKRDISMSGHREEQFSLAGLIQVGLSGHAC